MPALRNRTTPLHIRLLRLARLKLHLLSGVITAMFVLPLLSHTRREQHIRAWCGKLLATLNIRVSAHGEIPHADTRRALFVANHISWIDVWALKQLHVMNFVAKAEIRRWPVIGWLAASTGTLFIERERRSDAGHMMNGIALTLQREECLCFFPEGTTTDGTELKPFKSSLFQAAINAEAMIWPVAIYYPREDGGPNTAIAYHGDVTMLQSLWEVLKQREIVVELHFSAPMPAQGHERRHLSHHARQAISSLLHLRRHTAPDTPGGPPCAVR